MVKDTFFSTPVYYAGLADAETLNEHLKKDIRAWQKQDPEGTVRSNVAQAGAWHSATDMHTRGEFNGLTREIFELVQGIYDKRRYSRLISIRADGIPTPGTRCFFNLWRVV